VLVPALQAGGVFSARATRASARDARSSPGYNRPGLRSCATDRERAANKARRRRLTAVWGGPTWRMTTRRRKLLFAATLPGVVAALLWTFGRGGGKMEVKLTFLGYTNASHGHTNTWPSARSAVVIATNTGTVPVVFNHFVRSENAVRSADGESLRDDFAIPIQPMSPSLLRPGQSVLVYPLVKDLRKPWYTEVAYRRRGVQDRLYDQAREFRNSTVRRITSRVLPRPNDAWIRLGPITNHPPDTAASDLPRVARP